MNLNDEVERLMTGLFDYKLEDNFTEVPVVVEEPEDD